MIKMISWNTGFARQPWFELSKMDIDIALLQETCTRPEGLDSIELSPYRFWREESYSLRYLRPPRLVKVSDRVKVEWYEQVEPHRGAPGTHQMPVSGIGLCDAAIVTPLDGGEPITVVSMYAAWDTPHPTLRNGSIYPDGSAHRIISDLSVFLRTYEAQEPEHRIIAAGDLNMCFGDSDYFTKRAQTIFDRMSALGLEYMGPRYPNGRKAEPVPKNLTEDTLDVPTFYSTAMTSETAQQQLDHVFASRGLAKHITTRAMNSVEEWGPSDHCRIAINVDSPTQAEGL